MIKFNSILKFIIHLSTIYINPMFTYYLIKVVWGFGVEMLAFALALIKCCCVAKVRETLLRNFFWERSNAGRLPQQICVCI